jgi:hypothetical protein
MGFENGSVWEVRLEATNGDDSQVNTFHYDADNASTTDGNDPQSLADAFRDDVRPVWGSLYSSAWTLQPVVVQDVKDPLHPLDPRSEWTSGAPTPGTGTTAGDLLPPNCNVLVHLATAHIGRRFNGRLWLGGSVEEADQANGVWASGYLGGIATILAAIPRQPDISPPLSPATCKWSVYSRTQRAANLDPYLSAITSATARTLVHTLRSRALYA